MMNTIVGEIHIKTVMDGYFMLDFIKRLVLFKNPRMIDGLHDPSSWKGSVLSAPTVLAVLLTVLSFVLAPTIAGAQVQQPMFGLMFPSLPAYQLAGTNSDQLQTLMTLTAGVPPGPLFDPNIAAGPPRALTAPNDDNPDNVPSFFTYFGQFLDHDMILDKLPVPDAFVDPKKIPNFRDPRLNLDSVFLGGPTANPELYQADGVHLRVNLVNDRDLPRNPDGSAIIGEGRNDENQIIAQIDVAFLRAYNHLIDSGYTYASARELLKWQYQWIVVHEFLKHVLELDVYSDVFRPDGSIYIRYFDSKQASNAVMPVEFSVAAYRFGHSQVRKAYIVAPFDNTQAATNPPNTNPPVKLQVFNGTANDLHGGRPITADHVIFWPNFLPVDGQPSTGQFGTGQPVANIGRKIDPLVSSGLFSLPIPGAELTGSVILVLRNLQRSLEYGLPSGQAVAKRLNQNLPTNLQIHVLSNAEIENGTADANGIKHLVNNGVGILSDPAYKGEVPLWLYVVAEARIVNNGAKLGPVGSRIVAEVIGGLLAGDSRSYYRRGWKPTGGDFRAQDLLREAGELPPTP
jgi:hypothetical protein